MRYTALTLLAATLTLSGCGNDANEQAIQKQKVAREYDQIVSAVRTAMCGDTPTARASGLAEIASLSSELGNDGNGDGWDMSQEVDTITSQILDKGCSPSKS